MATSAEHERAEQHRLCATDCVLSAEEVHNSSVFAAVYRLQGERVGQRCDFVLRPLLQQQLLDALVLKPGSAREESVQVHAAEKGRCNKPPCEWRVVEMLPRQRHT